MSKLDLSAFGAFYRPTGKGVVTRYGCPPGDRSIIGAVFKANGSFDHVDPAFVMALSHDEAIRYACEYKRAVRSGALVEATATEYEKSLRSQEPVKEK